VKIPYDQLLSGTPDHKSPLFLQFLRDNNTVILETGEWLVIENYKYHTPESPWYTAFWKGHKCDDLQCEAWWTDIDELWYHDDWADWEWLKKPVSKQTVKRFHIHIFKKSVKMMRQRGVQ